MTSSLVTDLVSYYKCDVDGSFLDSCGSNNGTINGATYTSSGKVQGAYNFDGVNDYVSSLYSPTITSNDSISFGCWFKTNNTSNLGTIMGQTSYNSGYAEWTVYINTDYLRAQLRDGSNPSVQVSTAFTDTSNWNHVIIVVNRVNDTLIMYLNGSVVSSEDISSVGDITSSEQFCIGRSGSPTNTGYYFNGLIDEIGIWDRALTSTEVTELYNSGTGITYDPSSSDFIDDSDIAWGQVSYYKSDSSSSFPDVLGKNNGTVNGATYSSSGKINGAYDYDGSNDYVTLFSVNNYSALTISAWINTDSWADNDGLICSRDGDGLLNGLIFMDDAGDGVHHVGAYIHTANGVANCKSNTIISNSTWYHLVMTYDGSTVKLYINGSQETNTASITGNVNIADSLKVGQDDYGGRWFDGLIDEIGIWSRALTSTEVTELYNSGTGLSYPFSSTSNNISKINGVNWSGINKIKGVTKTTISKINGVSTT